MPFPLPVPPAVTLTQEALLDADHAHPLGAVTLDELAPPAAAMLRLVGEIENVHPTPVCVTVNVCPPIVSVPVRAEAALLAATT